VPGLEVRGPPWWSDSGRRIESNGRTFDTDDVVREHRAKQSRSGVEGLVDQEEQSWFAQLIAGRSDKVFTQGVDITIRCQHVEPPRPSRRLQKDDLLAQGIMQEDIPGADRKKRMNFRIFADEG